VFYFTTLSIVAVAWRNDRGMKYEYGTLVIMAGKNGSTYLDETPISVTMSTTNLRWFGLESNHSHLFDRQATDIF
jgi:hypothetical protein